jgi:glycosyltransferase involved in cell wall biosynthesis
MTCAKRSDQFSFQERKILWIYPFALDAALQKKDFLEILKSMAKRGYRICLIAMRSRRAYQFHENSRIQVISTPLRYLPVVSPIMFAIVVFFLLPVYIIRFKPNFIITRPDVSILGLLPALPFSKFKKVKLVLDIRSTEVETGGFRGFLRNFWFAPSILAAKALFSGLTIVTPLMRREVCRRFQINPHKIGVWTNGVDTALFNPKNTVSESIELKRKLGLSRKFVVFYHGVMSVTRGLSETIKAIELLKGSSINVVLFLLGTGPAVPTVENLVREKELQKRVIIHDPVQHREVPKYIAMSDVCIIPLPNHPFWRFQCPLKLLEYLAMEKVVIATDIPAHRLVTGEEKCAIYISSIEPVEMEKSIVYTYNNRRKLEEWGKSGREIITEKYEWEKVATDLESYLLSLDNS